MENIRSNARAFRQYTERPVYAVVKADAYGHGAIRVVNALQPIVDGFAVAILEEALAISTAACGKEILVFTPPLDQEEVRFGAEHGFTLSVTDYGVARWIDGVASALRIPVRAQLKINTGMNRYGMQAQALGKACKLLQGNPFVQVTGAYSHLYGSSLDSAEKQRLVFLRAQEICRRYFPDLRYHLSATYGATLGKRYAFDASRIGLGLYGYLPQNTVAPPFALRKAMTVYAPVTATRSYVFGGAGYGAERTELPKDGKLFTLRLGYADGFLRRRDNGTFGAAHNANALCMDACIREGIAKKGIYLPVMTDAAQTAFDCDTVTYEVLCAATRRATRIYGQCTEEGEKIWIRSRKKSKAD